MTLEMIGADLGQTGTMSLEVALVTLAVDLCYHMTEVFANPEHVGLWEAAVSGDSIDWYELFRVYRTTVDWSGATFYENLVERYPGSRVILTVRDPDGWYESTQNTIYNIQNVASFPIFSLGALFLPRMAHMRRTARMPSDLAWKGMFDGRFEGRHYAIEVFNRWNRG